MDDNMKEYFQTARQTMQSLGKYNPEAMKGFQNFIGAIKSDGALTEKTKELIGIGISVAKQCKFCVAWHVKNALDRGATKEEIIEAGMTAITLDGGSSMMFMKYVLKAVEEFIE